MEKQTYVCRKLWLYYFLTDKGFRPFRIVPDKVNPDRLVWLYTNGPELEAAVTEYYSVRRNPDEAQNTTLQIISDNEHKEENYYDNLSKPKGCESQQAPVQGQLFASGQRRMGNGGKGIDWFRL